MSFWSQSSDPRRIRTNPRSGGIFRDTSPEREMFFDTTPNFGFTRSNLADRLGSSVFEDFPTRRTMHSFPSHPESPNAFGSLHRQRQHPGWSTSEDQTSQESSPKVEGRASTLRRPFFQRSESNPVRVAHESHRGSRSSTPESTGSSHSHGSGHSKTNSNDRESNAGEEGGVPEGVEEYPGVSARAGRQSFTPRRQPKVHHIPIHVEPRDGSQPVVVTPPADATLGGTGPNAGSPSTPRRFTVQHPVFAMPAPNDARRRPLSGHEHPPTAAAATEELVDEEGPVQSIPILVDETKAPDTEASPPPRDGKKTPVDQVERVLQNVENLRKEVSEFTGVRGDKQYLFLDEMMTRSLIKLDNINTEGNEDLRKARRAVVVAINHCIQLLEQRVSQKEKGGEDPPHGSVEPAGEARMADESDRTTDGQIPLNSFTEPGAAETKEEKIEEANADVAAEPLDARDSVVDASVDCDAVAEPQVTLDSSTTGQLENSAESEPQNESKDDATATQIQETGTVCSPEMATA